MTLDEVQTYSTKLPGLKGAGYSYVYADKGVYMLELYINDCEEFIYLIKVTHYCGFLSVRFMEGQRLVINIGHDEFILKKCFFF